MKWIIVSVLLVTAQIVIPRLRWFKPKVNHGEFRIRAELSTRQYPILYLRCPVEDCTESDIHILGDTPMWRMEDKILRHIREHHR